MADDVLRRFDDFIDAVRARLEKGRAAYGDASFERPEAELLGELQQEALDLAGWGFVLWTRLESLQARLATAAPRPSPVARMVGSERGA